MTSILVRTAAAIVAAIPFVPAHAQEQNQRSQPGWPCAGRVDSSHIRVAEATGGKVTLLHPTELGEATGIEVSADRQHDETVFRAGGHMADGTYEFDFPIDSTIESAYFYLSMQCLTDAAVFRASGDELRADPESVKEHRFRAVRMFTVKSPEPGPWKVRVTGRGFMTIVVSAKTPLTADVAFMKNGERLKGEPVPDARQPLEVSMLGPGQALESRFISWSAATLLTINLQLERDGEPLRSYGGEAIVPAAAFRVAVTGIDSRGYPFQRVRPQLFNSESLARLP